jgi:hypothetical protein
MNLHTSPRRWIAAASLCLCMGLPTAAIGIPSYRVSVDTSAFDGVNGFIDLQFNSASGTPDATAAVSGFFPATMLNGPPTIDGAVTGALAGTLTFANGPSFFNALLQPVIFGSEFSFLVSFTGAFETASAGDGTAFAVGLFREVSGNADAPLLQADPDSGASLVFDLMPGAAPDFTVSDGAITVSAIPEPGVGALVAVGLLAMAVGWPGRRRHAGPLGTGPLPA